MEESQSHYVEEKNQTKSTLGGEGRSIREWDYKRNKEF